MPPVPPLWVAKVLHASYIAQKPLNGIADGNLLCGVDPPHISHHLFYFLFVQGQRLFFLSFSLSIFLCVLPPALLAERGKGIGRDTLAIAKPFRRLIHSRTDFANLTDGSLCVFRAFGAVAKAAEIAVAAIWQVGVERSSNNVGCQWDHMPSDLVVAFRRN
jgi:hypothetical protein